MAKFWEYSLRQFFGNTAARISLLLYLFLVILAVSFTFYSYNTDMQIAKVQELGRLEAITTTLSASIDSQSHNSLMNSYKEKDVIETVDQEPIYAEMHRALRAAHDKNRMTSDIYTMVKTERGFEFGVSSGETPYFRHIWTHPQPEHTELYEIGGSVGPYTDENGTWLSAFSPVKNAKGETVAIVQTDTRFESFMAEVRHHTLNNILIQLAVFLVISIVLLFFLSRILEKDDMVKNQLIAQSLEIEVKNKDLLDSMQAAKRIQEAFIPSQGRMKRALDSFFNIYLPKDIVSGDFLWFQEVDGKVYMAVGDCTGHGIPGALMSMVGSSALDFALTQGRRTPSEILDALDLIVQRNFSQKGRSYEAMDISLCCFDPASEELTYASAMRPLMVYSEGELKKYKGEKRSIGTRKDLGFSDVKVPIKKGDRIYMFSDGYPDQFGGVKGKKYMSKRFEKFIQNIQGHSLEEQQFLFKYEFHHWKSEEFQVDDVLVAAFEIPYAEAERLRA